MRKDVCKTAFSAKKASCKGHYCKRALQKGCFAMSKDVCKTRLKTPCSHCNCSSNTQFSQPFINIAPLRKDRSLFRTFSTLLQKDRAHLRKDRAHLRKDKAFLHRKIGLFCGNSALFCRKMKLFCRKTGLVGGKLGFFCGNTALFVQKIRIQVSFEKLSSHRNCCCNTQAVLQDSRVNVW